MAALLYNGSRRKQSAGRRMRNGLTMKLRMELLSFLLFTAGTMALFCAGCAVFHQEPADEPIEGGTVTHTDSGAPKQIESREIREFDARFFLYTRYSGAEDRLFHFTLAKDEAGTLMAKEENRGIASEAGEELLGQLQNVIEQYELVKQNGIYNVTAGLPPEAQPGGIHVVYESGETLQFTTDNDPYAAWSAAFYDVFSAWFARCGIDALEPQLEATLPVRFSLRLRRGDIWTDYRDVSVEEKNAIEGETDLLEKSVYDESRGEETAARLIRVPDDYYSRIREILRDSGFERSYLFSYESHGDGYYGMGSHEEGEEDAADQLLDIYIEYESGHRINIETKKESEIRGFDALIEALCAYLDPLFD